MSVILRDYQQKAVEGTLHCFSENKSALVVLPTGCGKTVVFAEVIRRVLRGEPGPLGDRPLV